MWTPNNQNVGKIERSWMNGDKREAFVSQNILWPSGLTFDYDNDILYWCDAFLKVIEKVNLDGTGRKVWYFLCYYCKIVFWSNLCFSFHRKFIQN